MGIQSASGDYFITTHSDVFVKADDWLDPMLREIRRDSKTAGAGAWKLHMENPLYAFQKRVIGYMIKRVKMLLGLRKDVEWKIGHYPRDYCAMYRKDIVLGNNLQFLPLMNKSGGFSKGGGYSISTQIWQAGYITRMIRTREMSSKIVHIAHGTAGVAEEKPLKYKRKQKKFERRVERLLRQSWIKELEDDLSLD